MFAFSTPEIDSFRTMFEAADHSPTLVAEVMLDSVLVSTVSTKTIDNQNLVQVSPTITHTGRVTIEAKGNISIKRIQIWDAAGHLVWDKPWENVPIQLPNPSGVYFISIQTARGSVVKKVVKT